MNRIVLKFLAVCCIAILTSCSDGSNNIQGEERNKREQGNPFDQGTGHNAGYEWAERTGGDCNGNSNSFNEGCEEYYQQQEQ
jgi:hypothetical protein